ncbi:hypothetical protein COOONC_05218 [Cooperia oncophora]
MIIGKLSRFGFGRSLKMGKMAFYCVAMSYVASVPNFMAFNYAVRRLWVPLLSIPCVFCMILIGFPVTYLELALGQYTQSTMLTVFDRIAPISFGRSLTNHHIRENAALLLLGVGVSATILLMVSTIIDNDILAPMALSLYHTFDIFGTEPHWYDCAGDHIRESG